MTASPTPLPVATAIGRPRAVLLALCGMAGFSALDSVVKAIGPEMPTFELVFFRSAGGAFWLALYTVALRRPWPQRRYLPRHALRAVLTLVTSFSFFYAFTRLPLALVTALAMSAPVYVGLLGVVFLKERPTVGLLAAVLLALAGSLIVIVGNAGNPFAGASGDPLAWLAALVGPFAYALQLLLLKTHPVDEPATAMTLAQGAMVAAATLPLALGGGFVPPPVGAWPLLVLLGLLGTGAFLLLVAALRALPASVFALTDYTALLWAALFGFLFFAEVPGGWLWLGGALIVSACVVGVRGAR